MIEKGNNHGELCGCVLAGGLSSRMGRDKAQIRPFGGPTMLEMACAVLQRLCPVVFISCGGKKDSAALAAPRIFDALPGRGPISGIIAALEQTRAAGFAGALALACDMPLMRADILAELTCQDARGKLGCFFQNGQSGKVEMLAGIYFPAALPRLQEAVNNGNYGLFAALPGQFLHLVSLPKEWERNFSNCNTPQELAKLHGASW